jgi:hypothetical protein
MSEDLIRVVIDYNTSDLKDKSNIDTGKFVKIYSGEEINITDLPNK